MRSFRTAVHQARDMIAACSPESVLEASPLPTTLLDRMVWPAGEEPPRLNVAVCAQWLRYVDGLPSTHERS